MKETDCTYKHISLQAYVLTSKWNFIMWVILVLAVVVLAFFWRSNQRRAHRFVRAVHFLDELDRGATSNEANGVVIKLFTKHSTVDADADAIQFATGIAQKFTNGNQLPWIHEAREKGFSVDTGNSQFDLAHKSGLGQSIDANKMKKAVYLGAHLAHVRFVESVGRELDDLEFVAAAFGVLDGTIQASPVKPNHVDMLAMGSTFALRQLKGAGRMIGAQPGEIGDLIGRVLVSECVDLEDLRNESSRMAFSMSSAAPTNG